MAYRATLKRRLKTYPPSQLGSVITGGYAKRQRTAGGYVPRLLPVSNARVQQLMAQRSFGNRGLVTTEIKGVDIVNPAGGTTQAIFPLTSTVSFTVVNLLTAGSSSWQRIGRKITMKSLQIQGWFKSNEANGHEYQEPSFARMMVVYDKQPNGSAPNINDILLSQVNAATDSNASLPESGINLNNRERFEIIRDMRFSMGPSATAGNGNYNFGGYDSSHHINVYIPLGNRETQYKADSTPGVVGDIATGSLLFITFGNVANTANPYDFWGSLRLRYADV